MTLKKNWSIEIFNNVAGNRSHEITKYIYNIIENSDLCQKLSNKETKQEEHISGWVTFDVYNHFALQWNPQRNRSRGQIRHGEGSALSCIGYSKTVTNEGTVLIQFYNFVVLHCSICNRFPKILSTFSFQPTRTCSLAVVNLSYSLEHEVFTFYDQ